MKIYLILYQISKVEIGYHGVSNDLVTAKNEAQRMNTETEMGMYYTYFVLEKNL